MQSETTRWNGKNALSLYIILAFGITWLCWIPALVISDNQGYILPTIANITEFLDAGFDNPQHIFVSILFSFAVYGPLIAGLVVTYLESGKAGIANLLGRIVKWRVAGKWYGMVMVITTIIPLVPLLIGLVSGSIAPNAAIARLPFLLIVAMFVWQLLTSGLGEEPGWRGYVLPYLQKHTSSGRAIWILGVIWAAWHYPFTIYDTLANTAGLPVIGIVITIVMSLAGQTISLIGMTYIYVWLYNETQSLLIAILFHALSNLLPRILLVGLPPSLSLLVAVMPWVVVFVLERIYGKERFPGD